MNACSSKKPELSRLEFMRARRRRRRLKQLAALAVVSAVSVVLLTVAFAVRDTRASGTAPTAAKLPPTVPEVSVQTPSSTATSLVGPRIGSAPSGSDSAEPPGTTTTMYVHTISDPSRIVIPAIGVDATVIQVGLLASGDMEVPSFGLAGWYKLGPAPGAGGPAVIVAHVDTKSGPDVFYHLKELEPDDEIVVYGQDGDAATFVVDSREQSLKRDLPTDRIWNDTWEPVLRLITCGGDFDRAWGHYLSNVIVYAHLVQ